CVGGRGGRGALGGPEPRVVEGQHGVAQRIERPGEPFRVDDLLSLVAGAGDDRRVRGPGATVIGQMQVGVEAQAAGEEGQGLAGHNVPYFVLAAGATGAAAAGSRHAPGPSTRAWDRQSAAALI